MKTIKGLDGGVWEKHRERGAVAVIMSPLPP